MSGFRLSSLFFQHDAVDLGGAAQASLARRTGRLFINYLCKVGARRGAGPIYPALRSRSMAVSTRCPWRLIGEMVRATVADGMVRIHYGLHEVAIGVERPDS